MSSCQDLDCAILSPIPVSGEPHAALLPLWFRIMRGFLMANAIAGMVAGVFLPGSGFGAGMALSSPDNEPLFGWCLLFSLLLLPVICIVTAILLFRAASPSRMRMIVNTLVSTVLLGIWFLPTGVPLLEKACTKIMAAHAASHAPLSARP
ncbi:hypothetical protein GOX01_19680 [Gluconobacter oxydans]|uniref:Uncharacterized protein n=3 Tax=Gluconobacter oxydans TaxID=442 RepID=Q5FQK1_GLUOX|nr:Hypothetical protein GOX1604 [Gluconobacter oxydans 621H]KXV34562.1 hypothetical protein AD939_02355 [Gluconobacter oxydans]GEC61637.1 hypothetical protein GOX01_19680 [Gluconobacter oxydans]